MIQLHVRKWFKTGLWTWREIKAFGFTEPWRAVCARHNTVKSNDQVKVRLGERTQGHYFDLCLSGCQWDVGWGGNRPEGAQLKGRRYQPRRRVQCVFKGSLKKLKLDSIRLFCLCSYQRFSYTRTLDIQKFIWHFL